MKKSTKLLMLALAVVGTLTFVGCQKGGNSSSSTTEEITIDFNCESIVMDEWETKTITAVSSDGSPLNFVVGDSSVLYVKGSKITALKPGKTTITATVYDNEAITKTIEVTVNEKLTNRPNLTMSCQNFVVCGNKATVNTTLSNVDGDIEVEYTSSNPSVATVNGSGIVTGVSVGKTKITATTKYRTVTFTAEKEIEVAQKVVFDATNRTYTLEMSNVTTFTEGYTFTVGEKNYEIVDGKATLSAEDFDLSETNIFKGKVTKNEEEQEFLIAVYDLSKAGIYQDGNLLIAEDGEYRVNKELAPDENGLHWLTFDDAQEKLESGYSLLRLTFKFESLDMLTAGIVHSAVGDYNYLFGFKYQDVWVYWDNQYIDGDKIDRGAYSAAILNSNGCPYGYGYYKLYDAETGALVMDYYHLEFTDASGTHGNWSPYVKGLEIGKEYTIEIDVEKTGDVTMSGFENAVITGFEWGAKEPTKVTYDQTEISIDVWDTASVKAKVNDSSKVEYIVEDPTVLYLDGDTVVGLKAGTTKVTAKTKTASAELTVTVTENTEKTPTLTLVNGTEVAENISLALKTKLSVGETEVNSGKYNVSYAFKTETELATLEGSRLKALQQGTVTVVATATYCGKTFTAEQDITIVENKGEVDPTVGKLYQNGVELVADANGIYKVDTSVDADGDGLRWITVNDEKTEDFTYFRMTVKFTSFCDRDAGIVWPSCGIYKYNFGFKYNGTHFFWDNTYASGGFGGACSMADGSANRANYLNIYKADGTLIANEMNTSGWTSYCTLELNTEYIFEFKVKAMGGGFMLAGFDGAEISNLVWSDKLLKE